MLDAQVSMMISYLLWGRDSVDWNLSVKIVSSCRILLHWLWQVWRLCCPLLVLMVFETRWPHLRVELLISHPFRFNLRIQDLPQLMHGISKPQTASHKEPIMLIRIVLQVVLNNLRTSYCRPIALSTCTSILWTLCNRDLIILFSSESRRRDIRIVH